MPRVQVPQYGTYIDFPDDVTPEQMTAVLTEHFPKRAAAKLAPTAGEALVEGLKSGATYKGYFAPGMPLANMNGGDQIPSESMAGPSYLTPPPAPTDAHAGIPDIPPPTAEELAVARLRRMGINVPDTPPEEPSFAARMAGSVGGIIGTAPEFAVGAVPGALVGGPAGGAIGGFAATGGLTEAQNPESGVGRVALSTAQGAGEGALMAAGGAAGGAIGAGAGKVAQVAGHALGAAAGLGVSPVLHGQAPTVQSFADALAMVALFEGVGGIHAVARGRERVLAGEKAGETPQQAFEAARQEVVPEPAPPEGGFRVSSVEAAKEAPISPVETPQAQVAPEPAPTPEVIPQAAPEAIPAPVASVQPQPETANGQKATDEAQGQRQAAEDVLTQPAGGESVTQVPPPAPVPQSTGLEGLTWNELTAKSEEANRSRDMATLKSVLDEVKARRAIGSSGPRTQPQPETPNASEVGKAATLYGDVQQPQGPQEGAGQVPARKGRKGNGPQTQGHVSAVPSPVEPAPPATAPEQPAAEQGQVSAVKPRGIGMRRATPEGRAMVEAAKQQLRDVINNPDIVGRQRGDMLENGKNLIQFLEAHAAHPEKLDIGYERGDKVAYTGMPAEPGFRTFIYLEGANAGKEAVAVTPEQSAANTAKRQSEWRDQQEQFSRLNKTEKQARKASPPRTGKVDSSGWLFEKDKGYSKDISGYKVEVRSHKNTAKDDKYEAVVNGSSIGRFGSASDAKRYAETNIETWAEQDLVDQRNAAEEEASSQKIPDNSPSGPAPADTGIFRDLTAAAREGKRFVEELHARIAPVLARIHVAAKSPVEFIKQAVEKFGAHIRPYAKRFLADVRRVNAEFAANPTRGSGPVWFSKLSNAVEDKMGGAMDAGELRKMLEGAGVKKEEMQWARLNDLQGKVSKQEVRDQIAANAIKVEEVHTVDNKKRTHYLLLGEDGEVEGAGDEIAARRWRNQGIPESRIKEEEVNAQGSTKFSDYQTPGGENYGELLLTIPAQPATFVEWVKNKFGATPSELSSGELEMALQQYKQNASGTASLYSDKNFKSSHFSEPNILVHVRHNDRVDADGKRVLFLEEVQSDWHQEGRKKGYKSGPAYEVVEDPVNDGIYRIRKTGETAYETFGQQSGWTDKAEAESVIPYMERGNVDSRVPDAPFKSTEDWTSLAMRRMVRYAAEHGYDRIAWTTGDMQAERYDLSKQVDAVRITKNDDGTFDVSATKDRDSGGTSDILMQENGVSAARVADLVGKDLAEKASSQTKKEAEYRGVDLKVGGEGMRKHYDQIMRNVANKIGKKWGARAGTTEIPYEKWRKASGSHEQATMTVHSLDIPPAMRNEVNIKGMPLFADTGILRDIEAAAKQGKKWVTDLHERVAPELAKLYTKAKGAVQFVRDAVAKFGDAIRPYAKRFLAEVKRGVRDETGARITGKGLTEGIKARFGKERKPLANPGTTPESRGFVDKVDTERAQPDAQTREQWERAADSLDRAEVWDALRKNKLGGKGPEWTIAAKRLTDEAAWNALQDGKNVADAWHVADDYRRTGTAIAREFSARYDPVLSPTERAQVAKANKELADLNTQMDNPDLSDAEHAALMDRYANTQQRINDIRTVGTARRMLSEIFTSPRKKTATTLKKLDKVIADRTTSEPERARKQAERDKVSKEEGRALEVMRRRMIKSGIPLDDPVAMTKRDNILRALSEAKAHKSTVVDKFEELYKNLMFSGSTPLNVIDNGIIMGNEFLVNRPLEMAINKALNLDPKAAGFDDTPYMLAALAPGLRRGVRNMIDSWRTEADMFELQTHGPNMNMSGKLEGRGAAITGRLGRTVRSMGYRPLMATDSFNKSVVAELEVAAYANRLANIRGLEGRAKTRFMQRQSLDYDSESWQHAVGRAENLTLTDEAGVVTKAVTELRDKIWPLRFLIPVVKTPSKALAMTLRKTPLGSARVAAKMYSDPLYTRKALAHDLAEQAAAWTVALGLYAMLRTGDKDAPGLPRITGNQPYSQKHYAEDKNKAMIAPPRSIRLGDKWYGYGTLGVVAGQIATTVDLLDALAEAKDDPLPALSNFMVHFMGNARDRTYLGSIDDIGQALEEGGLPKWATNFAGSWSPSALKKVVRMADPKERETRALDTQGKLSYKIFPFSDMAPAKVDLMGHEISKSPEDGPRSDILWRILPQSSVVDLAARDPLETNVYRMFINWNNQHPDKRWAPDAPQLSYKDGNEMKQWTPQQYHDLSMKAGGWASVMLKKINEKRPFNFDAPTEADKAVVDDVFKSGREYAKGVMLGELKKQKP